MGEFEKWFADQDFYTNMRFIHGDNLFSKDGDVYRVLPVQMTYVAYQKKPKPQRGKSFDFDLLDSHKEKIEQLERGKAEITRLVQSLRNEFDLNSDCPQVERQIELLEKTLRGES